MFVYIYISHITICPHRLCPHPTPDNVAPTRQQLLSHCAMKLPVFLDNNQMLNVVRPVTGASIATLVETLTAVLATGEGSTKDSTFMEVSWSVYAAYDYSHVVLTQPPCSQVINNSVESAPQYYDLKAARKLFPSATSAWWKTVQGLLKGSIFTLLKEVVTPERPLTGVSCYVEVKWVDSTGAPTVRPHHYCRRGSY
jgi:hypothetical protein